MTRVIKKQLALSKVNYYEKHLNIIKPFLPMELTPKEIEVLAVFMSIEGDLSSDRFGTSARKIVMSTTGISPGGLGNYLKALKEKGYLREDNQGSLSIWPLLYPDEKEQAYMFMIKKVEV